MGRRGMLEPVETVFREITRTGARCRSLKLARDLTSVGLVHHRRLVVKGSPVRGWRPIILARGILPNFSLSLSAPPNRVSTLTTSGRVVFTETGPQVLSSRALPAMGKIEGVVNAREYIFFRKRPSILAWRGIVELFKGTS